MIESAEEFIKLRLSDKMDEYLRAANEDAPNEVWDSIIKEHCDMKEWVVINKKVPLYILEILADDPNVNVRFAVAQKRKLSKNLFEKLARDSDESVRLAIACNKKTPIDILETLLFDDWTQIQEAVKKRLEERTGKKYE